MKKHNRKRKWDFLEPRSTDPIITADLKEESKCMDQNG